MAHWQLDQKDDAGQWYDKAIAWKRDNEAALQKDAELQRCFAEAAALLDHAADNTNDAASPAAGKAGDEEEENPNEAVR